MWTGLGSSCPGLSKSSSRRYNVPVPQQPVYVEQLTGNDDPDYVIQLQKKELESALLKISKLERSNSILKEDLSSVRKQLREVREDRLAKSDDGGGRTQDQPEGESSQLVQEVSTPPPSNENMFSSATEIREDVEPDRLYKIIVIGDSSVGKTQILNRWDSGKFISGLATTIHVELFTKIYRVNGEVVRIQLWDTAGQERFKSLTKQYYRGAMGVIVVYDVTRLQSFQNVHKWVEDVKGVNTDDSARYLLVGNKIDLETRAVTTNDGKLCAQKLGMAFFETSAREGINCDLAFQSILTEIHKQQKQSTMISSASPPPPSFLPDSVVLTEAQQQEEVTNESCTC
eukprot:TRINITY_DN2062_c0_g1_i12.p1 TRINITY_DN2062_c0_g1~~TRINITY_DN2062_c0_g1_i12.p1  ORF type:complete len:343 (+),score=93.27 TRINITY_DN2062_c0_g1_i12:496-1524(+)